jgi:hypothetical protein
MLSEIGFQEISGDYHYGYYGPFRVILDKSNGFINATKLCSFGGKEYKDWSRLKGSQELVETLQRNQILNSIQSLQASAIADGTAQYCPLPAVCKCIQTSNVTDTDRLISGTYCHPLLIPHIACWVSPNFALMVSEIINYFFVEEWRAKLAASEQSAAQLLLSLQEAQESATSAQLALEEQKNQLELMEVKQEEVVAKLDENEDTRIREKQAWSTTHAFSMMKLNTGNCRRPYYAIRCQGKRMSAAITKLRRKFPDAEVIYQQRKVPNTVNLYNRLKDRKAVEHTRNFCTPTCTEEELLYLLNSLCGTYYPGSNTAPFNNYLNVENSFQ